MHALEKTKVDSSPIRSLIPHMTQHPGLSRLKPVTRNFLWVLPQLSGKGTKLSHLLLIPQAC